MPKLTNSILPLIVLAMTFLGAINQQALAHVSITPADCVVVLPADLATRDKSQIAQLREAADELQYHFKLVFDVTLPILETSESIKPGQYPLYLGVIPPDAPDAPDDARPLANQEARYRVTAAGIWFYGHPANRGWGDLFAVYNFLEDELGIHWIEPGEAGVVHSRQNALSLRAGERAWVPQLVFRKIRQSIRHNQPHRPIGRPNTDDFLLPVETHNKKVAEELQWQDRMRMGGQRPGGAHAFSDWWGKHGKDHPDYFALTKLGTRAPVPLPQGKERSEEFIKICPSNPAVAQQLIQDWLPYRNIQQYISTGPNDGVQNFCECDNCKALDVPLPGEPFPTHLTDRYVHLTNAVARLAREHRPDAYATLYAYLTTLQPPRKLRLEPNVAVLIVPYVDPLKVSVAHDLFKGWKDAGATRLAIRPNYHHKYMSGPLPLGIEKQMFDVFQQAVENGAISADYDMLMGQWPVTGLSDYILAKAMMDPSQTFEHWEDQYCSGFGEAASDIKAYFRYWRSEVWEGRLLPAMDSINDAGRSGFFYRGLMWTMPRNDYYRLDDFDKTDALLQAAMAKAAQPAQQARVTQLMLANEHARKIVIAATAKGQDRYTAAQQLMAFRKSHKDDLNLSWVRLIGQEEQYNWTQIALADYLKQFPLPWLETGMAWKFRMDEQDIGLKENWQALAYDQINDWQKLRVDQFWERAYDSETEPSLRKRLAKYDGVAWYASQALTPREMKGRQVILYFGGVGDQATVYVNGKEVGRHASPSEKEKQTPFEIRIDQAINWDQRFQDITIRVENKTGMGGLFNRVWLVSRE